jgi:hypothetical protein
MTRALNHIAKWPDRSLGLACFSVAQRDAIEDSLQRCGVLAAAEAFAPKGERLFIKNLESVQGDERDVIFISIGYGPDAQGRMTAGFGPLSSDGGAAERFDLSRAAPMLGFFIDYCRRHPS